MNSEQTLWTMITPTTKEIMTAPVNNSFICLSELTMTVPAGSFDSYKINMTQPSALTSNNSEYFYAPTVGSVIMRNDTVSNTTSWMVTRLTLEAYSYGGVPEFMYLLIPTIAVSAIIVGIAYRFRINKKT